jgi:hypothetical protein
MLCLPSTAWPTLLGLKTANYNSDAGHHHHHHHVTQSSHSINAIASTPVGL